MRERGAAAGAQVVVDVPLFPLDRPFTYRVPEPLRESVLLGSRVKVPFGTRRRVDGWVVGWADELPEDARDLIRLVSPVPAFDAAGLDLLRWVAARYAGTLADVVRLAVPPRVAAVERDPVAGERGERLGDAGVAGGEPGRPAGAPAGTGPPRGADRLAGLVARGWAGAVYWRPLPGEDRASKVVALVEAALAQGRGAIVVTPEVAAGSAVADAVRKSFPDAADLSSDLSERRRYRAWVELRLGRRQVAIGGRSAVLAPVRRLGCIVIDDEANAAHKEQRAPRYHAREVALRRADHSRATCVLTGTVPSPEVVAAIQAGQCQLEAADRAVERRLRPLVEVVDPYEQDDGPGPARLHRRALAALREAGRRGAGPLPGGHAGVAARPRGARPGRGAAMGRSRPRGDRRHGRRRQGPSAAHRLPHRGGGRRRRRPGPGGGARGRGGLPDLEPGGGLVRSARPPRPPAAADQRPGPSRGPGAGALGPDLLLAARAAAAGGAGLPAGTPAAAAGGRRAGRRRGRAGAADPRARTQGRAARPGGDGARLAYHRQGRGCRGRRSRTAAGACRGLPRRRAQNVGRRRAA